MTPGTYIRLRRTAAELSIDDIAMMTETAPAVCMRSRAEWLTLIETDRTPITGDIVRTLRSAFAFDTHILVQLVAIHAGAVIDAPALCRGCGCSWNDPCVDDAGAGCAWSADDTTLCTTCLVAAAEASFTRAAPPITATISAADAQRIAGCDAA